MKIGIAADHRGVTLKSQLISQLEAEGYEVCDYGAFGKNPEDDFPDFVIPMTCDVSLEKIARGIAICGSGIGACIAANKVRNARAGLVHDVYSTRQGVEDDNMNIICLAAELIEFSDAWDLVRCFLHANFSREPRFRRRLSKINHIEELEYQ